LGCTVVNTDHGPGCSVKGKTIVNSFGDGLFILSWSTFPRSWRKYPFKFFLTTFIGAYIWCTLLIGAGYFVWQFRERIPALAWIKTKMDNNEL